MRGCQMMIGRLVSHPCGNRPTAGCASCARAICAHHLDGGSPARCLQCVGRYVPAPAPLTVTEGEMMTFDAAEIAAFDQAGYRAAPHHGDS